MQGTSRLGMSGVRGGYPFPPGRSLGVGYAPTKKMYFSLEMDGVLMHSEHYVFVSVLTPCQKNVKFSA